MTSKMSMDSCPREAEILERLARGGSPPSLDSAWTPHLSACVHCRELAFMVETLSASRLQALSEAGIPTASQVWWRAKVRARLEGAQAAERPITMAQGLAVAAITGIAASVVGLRWLTGSVHIVRDMAARLSGIGAADLVAQLLGASPVGWVVLVACACVVVLMPIAALLTLSEK